ncbi:NUDIX domain-containing protein [Enterovirga rhinocerotis]|uniref:ADP-ribose pyrophosphatase n=1 Tax=Enterovirga rhinocerotis TaxID=1339210 RepID=A0A4R7C9M3_9HYPH|nr:NUDIX domain-containing protein [Enterovirga rhinocerotis]TDR94752.1 nudix-type nucleoside diphosphatase (YffH/AdpP family) [Enterovirga rhinocerotis]
MGGPTIEAVETLYEGWGRYLGVTVRRPDGVRLKREVEDHGGAAGLLAYDPERRTALLVLQLRVAMLLAGGHRDTLEIVAGLIEEDETPEACIRREAMEEAGLAVREIEPVVVMQTMPGISTERIHLYLAAYTLADRSGPGGGVASEAEDITVVELSLRDLADMADRGDLPDAKTMLLLQTLRIRRPDLF